MNTIGARVRHARGDRTQEWLVVTAGLSKGFVSDIENDKRNLTVATALKLSDALGVSVEWLLRGHKPKTIKCPLCGKGTITL